MPTSKYIYIYIYIYMDDLSTIEHTEDLVASTARPHAKKKVLYSTCGLASDAGEDSIPSRPVQASIYRCT